MILRARVPDLQTAMVSGYDAERQLRDASMCYAYRARADYRRLAWRDRWSAGLGRFSARDRAGRKRPPYSQDALPLAPDRQFGGHVRPGSQALRPAGPSSDRVRSLQASGT